MNRYTFLELLRRGSQFVVVSLLFAGLLLSFAPHSYASPSGNPFGTIDKPPGIAQYETGGAEIGLLNFVSQLVRIITAVAGLILFFNFLIAGYTYLTSEGNPKAHENVRNRITFSVIGIVIIVSAYTIIALISLIFFGSATFVLNPEITPPP
jgi:hypothetical protein